MDTRFGRLMGRLHSVGMARTADAIVDYLDRQGDVLAEGIAVGIDDSAERTDAETDAVDRVRVIAVLRSALPRLDRKGMFREQDGKLWRIDGIHEDDHHLISLYVVPE
ncbi:hypothetical protein [Pseudomonas nitroreducens]|uniref:hypothetical protein n=1 Tax=Pseudomonas nitroreducens TaxID=46680 RepID=UPI003CC833B6